MLYVAWLLHAESALDITGTVFIVEYSLAAVLIVECELAVAQFMAERNSAVAVSIVGSGLVVAVFIVGCGLAVAVLIGECG